jgi:hypothetical protein
MGANMTLAAYLRWLGIGAVVVVVLWVLSRRLRSRVARLGVRCLAIAAALTPQPLWIPGQGGAVMPALAILVSGRPSVFVFAMGIFPIIAVAGLLFALAGLWLGRGTEGAERRLHRVVRRWALMGVLLPWLALAVWVPFVAYFGFGGPIAMWGVASLALLAGAAAADEWVASRYGVELRLLSWATWLLAVLLALAVLWRTGGFRYWPSSEG